MKKIYETAFTQYSEIRLIGNGGNSNVYEVSDEEGTLYAAKVLKQPNNSKNDVVKRFKNEMHFSMHNTHKNIIKVLDSGVIKSGETCYPFYIMEKYSTSLRSLINDGINRGNYLKYVNQILDGVEAAHLLGIIHRDIKPENILYDSQTDNLVISDFGIAEFTKEQLFTIVETKDGTRLANFQYASPEQRMRGKVVDKRTDIYSLGLLFIEMATKELAVGTSYKKIESIFSDCSYLDTIFGKMISQDPKDRYASIDEIKKDMIGKSQEYIQLQRLNEERNKVITFKDIDDPLVQKQNRIIAVDWNNNNLTITLEMPVNQKWIVALQSMGSYTSVWGKGPENFNINGNRATIGSSENEAQTIIDYFKQWLPLAHSRYVQIVQEEKNKEEREIIEQQKRKIREAETKGNR